MTLKDFYKVSESTKKENLRITRILVDRDHELYKGHFPGRPVTPGVVLMQLFKEDAERAFDKKLRMLRADNVKFISVFDPTDDNELILESDFDESGEYIKLKGVAKTKAGIVLKISSLYQIV